jgi:hypothetical protein
MKIYDTLIVGSGYGAVGYALARENTVICEEHQVCDTSFYLPMRTFCYKPYTPKTKAGADLLDVFNSFSLFKNGVQNTNGFEYAFCKFIYEKDLTILLKCRVIRVCQKPDGIYDVTVQTNEGLTHLFAKQVLDATDCTTPTHYTVLFVCNSIDTVRQSLSSCFEGAQIEPTAYENRYALHFVCADTDENRIKLEVYHKWHPFADNAKILYMAPVFFGEGGTGALCDGRFENPIEAFEAGYLYGKEQANVSIDA